MNSKQQQQFQFFPTLRFPRFFLFFSLLGDPHQRGPHRPPVEGVAHLLDVDHRAGLNARGSGNLVLKKKVIKFAFILEIVCPCLEQRLVDIGVKLLACRRVHLLQTVPPEDLKKKKMIIDIQYIPKKKRK